MRLRQIWPLLVGILTGCALVWQRTTPYRLMDFPTGSDWHQYLSAAWLVHEPQYLYAYPDWRQPLYPWLFGLLAQSSSWLDSSVLISHTSTFLLVISSGLIGWVLAGPWAGGLAALALPSISAVITGAHWMNHYPLLAAATGLSLAASAAWGRFGGWRWALMSGLLAGIAVALDTRGTAVLPAAGLALLLNLKGPGKGQVVAGILLFLLAYGVPISSHRVLAPSLKVLALSRQLMVQRSLTLNELRLGPYPPEVKSACTNVPRAEDDSPLHNLRSPCARVLLEDNTRRLVGQKVLPPLWLFLFLPLLLLPASLGWRSVVMAVGVYGGPLASAILGATWVFYWDRYALQLMPPLAALVPVALYRVTNTVGAKIGRPRVEWLAVLLAAGLLWKVWPASGGRGTWFSNHDTPDPRLVSLYNWVKPQVQHTDQLYDCTGQGLETLWLPRLLHAEPLNFAGIDVESCTQYTMTPPPGEGARWLLTGTFFRIQNLDPQVFGWERVAAFEENGQGFYVWRWRKGEASPQLGQDPQAPLPGGAEVGIPLQ